MAEITEEEYLNQLEQQLEEQSRVNRKLQSAQMSLFSGAGDENLIKYQLDLREELDRLYHLLRGDEVKEDEKGNVVYISQEHGECQTLNEFGVQLIMNVLSFYLNRNTILSHYDEPTISLKVYDFGIEISDLIFNRYEEMMLTTTFEEEFRKLFNRETIELNNGRLGIWVYSNGRKLLCYIPDYMVDMTNLKIDEHLRGKIKMYPMLIREIVDSIHSTYLRALGGEEKKSLREARTVTQSDMLGRQMPYPIVSQQKKRTLNPMTWLKT